MFALSFALSVSAAWGFQALAPQRTATSLGAMSESIPFLTAPKNLDGYVGNVGFDPLGFAEAWDIKYMREAELKHGRVAMMAIVGCIAPELGFHFPGEAFSHTDPIKAAIMAPPAAWAAVIFGAGCYESISNDGKMGYLDMFSDPSRVPGEFDLDSSKLLTPENTEDLKLKEITHCRLAMIAIGGLLHQSFVTGAGVFGGPTV
mmetsp:Transcript_8914/g.27437  ORF Transcript_8914/g.27437 Transcript_8914/m.27437 type:complete len:203 (+) Transcript_8914:54-662(+)